MARESRARRGVRVGDAESGFIVPLERGDRCLPVHASIQSDRAHEPVGRYAHGDDAIDAKPPFTLLALERDEIPDAGFCDEPSGSRRRAETEPARSR